MSIGPDVEALRQAAAQGRVQWNRHALERIQERAISLAEVVEAIMHGEIIEVYSDDRPHPSCLIYRRSEEPVHVVAAADPVARVAYVVTAYRPSLAHFEKDLKTRRRES